MAHLFTTAHTEFSTRTVEDEAGWGVQRAPTPTMDAILYDDEMALKSKLPFDAEAFLSSPGVAATVVDHAPEAVIFSQGESTDAVFSIQRGRVKLSVVSTSGKEAVLGILGPGDFFGEGALAGQPVRLATATTMGPTRILTVPKRQMIRLLHQQPAFSDRFMNKFRKLGFIEYDGGLKIHNSLLSVVLHDSPGR